MILNNIKSIYIAGYYVQDWAIESCRLDFSLTDNLLQCSLVVDDACNFYNIMKSKLFNTDIPITSVFYLNEDVYLKCGEGKIVSYENHSGLCYIKIYFKSYESFRKI